MNFYRKLEAELHAWRGRSHRKPLILRGARQTGKTTLVRGFGKFFENFVELNLEKPAHKNLFQELSDPQILLRSIEGVVGQRIIPGKTLLFIDEIQNSGVAIQALRYFFEEIPALHVLATGSLLEVRVRKEGWSFPVGRVEFLYLYPLSFDEFLLAKSEDVLLELLKNLSVEKKDAANFSEAIHNKCRDLLAEYLVVGGMPAAVRAFVETNSFIEVCREHESLSYSFEEDFEKYATETEVQVLRRIWERVPYEMGRRVLYTKLVDQNFRSLQVSRALDILHDAMLVERVLPTASTSVPLLPRRKAAPKLLPLDVGLSLSVLKISFDQIRKSVFAHTASGSLWETYVGQELLAMDHRQRRQLYFWAREEKGASSEVDYIWAADSVLPIEVKSGVQGSLKSLHQFLLRSEKNFAIRVYDGPLSLQDHRIETPQKTEVIYRLLSLPPYLVFRLPELIDGRVFSLNSKN